MTEIVKDGGPAFPCEVVQRDENGKLRGAPIATAGMSLRDYFAGQAFVAMYASLEHAANTSDLDIKADAETAYRIADAMLKARSGADQ